MRLKIFIAAASMFLLVLACSKDANLSGSAGTAGSTARMVTYGNYLYMVTTQKLFTYDISVPGQTFLVETQNIGWDAETIFPYKNHLFIGRQNGMYVFDISQPQKPQLKGQVQHLRACDPVVADDHFAYVTLRGNNGGCGGNLNELQIYDIQGTHILIPRLVSTLPMSQPNGLGLKGDILYVAMGDSGLNVVDVANRNVPKAIKTIKEDVGFVDVIPYGDVLLAYVNGGIFLYDISNATNPVLLSKILN